MIDYFNAQNLTQIHELITYAMERKGISLDDLAEKMGLSPLEIEQLLEENPTLGFITEVLFILGYGLMVSVKPLINANYEQAKNWSEN